MMDDDVKTESIILTSGANILHEQRAHIQKMHPSEWRHFARPLILKLIQTVLHITLIVENSSYLNLIFTYTIIHN